MVLGPSQSVRVAMDISTWPTIGPAVLASFLASLVEVVEAFTIVLAVGTVQCWRPALSGAIAGLAVLAVAIAILGPALELIPLRAYPGFARLLASSGS